MFSLFWGRSHFLEHVGPSPFLLFTCQAPPRKRRVCSQAKQGQEPGLLNTYLLAHAFDCAWLFKGSKWELSRMNL